MVTTGPGMPLRPVASRPNSSQPLAPVISSSAPLFSNHLQSLLYRHSFLSGIPMTPVHSSLCNGTDHGVHSDTFSNTKQFEQLHLSRVSVQTMPERVVGDSLQRPRLTLVHIHSTEHVSKTQSHFAGCPSLGSGSSSGSSGLVPQTGPITLPGTGTTVFPLPGSFPWAAGSRGASCHKM